MLNSVKTQYFKIRITQQIIMHLKTARLKGILALNFSVLNAHQTLNFFSMGLVAS
jgi:hypothetical protein